MPISCRRLLTLLVSALTLLLAGAAPSLAARDPLLAEQWSLRDPALGVDIAWTQSLGQKVVVAILDSGVQLDHPDLAANVWTNPGEIAGNGVDDDRNGFVDDVHGANMLGASANAGDDDGHGTHVAHRRGDLRATGSAAPVWPRRRGSWPSRSSTPRASAPPRCSRAGSATPSTRGAHPQPVRQWRPRRAGARRGDRLRRRARSDDRRVGRQ